MQELLRENQQFWNEKHQEATGSVKQALAEATCFGIAQREKSSVLQTDACKVAKAEILHKEQEHIERTYRL